MCLWTTRTVIFKTAMILFEQCRKHFCFCVKELFKVLPNYPRLFDSTLGFPGEGWTAGRKSKRQRKKKTWSATVENLSMATWNTRSMTHERYDFCKSMGYDVLAVCELWRTQEKFTTRTNEFTISATARDKHVNLVNGNDPAAGVGILLSPRAQKKVADGDG